jgi:hypothetical protein
LADIVEPSSNLTFDLTVIASSKPPFANWYELASQGCMPEVAGFSASIS